MKNEHSPGESTTAPDAVATQAAPSNGDDGYTPGKLSGNGATVAPPHTDDRPETEVGPEP